MVQTAAFWECFNNFLCSGQLSFTSNVVAVTAVHIKECLWWLATRMTRLFSRCGYIKGMKCRPVFFLETFQYNLALCYLPKSNEDRHRQATTTWTWFNPESLKSVFGKQYIFTFPPRPWKHFEPKQCLTSLKQIKKAVTSLPQSALILPWSKAPDAHDARPARCST